jgi:hypothetical protein
MLIPIAAFIWGWLKSNPAVPPPPDLNPISSNIVIEDEDYCFVDSEDTFAGVDTDNTSMNMFIDDDCDTHMLSDDLMFDPANSWCSFNIYHHDD